MNVITIGSKIIDDAIVECGDAFNIKNVSRITNISPFSLCFNKNLNENQKEFFSNFKGNSKNAYVEHMQRVEMGYSFDVPEEFEAVVIDVLDARLPFYEVTFDCKDVVRITDSNYNADIIKYLKECDKSKEHIDIKKIEPIKCTQEELEQLFYGYAEWLKCICNDKKVILACNHNAYQNLSEDGTFAVSDIISTYVSYNRFYDWFVDILKDMIECTFIPAPDIILSNPKDNTFFSLDKSYYQYIAASISDIANGKYDSKMRLCEYQDTLRRYYEKCITDRLIRDISMKCAGRDIVLIGGTKELESNLCEKTGNSIFVRIDINSDTSEQEIQDKLPADNRRAHLYVVVFFTSNIKITGLLKNMGIDFNKDVVLVRHNPVVLTRFMGRYEDIFGNYFDTQTYFDIELYGCGNRIDVGLHNRDIKFDISVGDENVINIADNAQSALNRSIFMQCIMGAEISIESGSHIVDNLRLYAGRFGKIIIRKSCLISTDVLLHCGNGFAERTGADDSVILEEWVWLGYRTTLLAGAHIHSGCVVGARALVTQEIPKNCMVVGDPARIIKKDVTWHNDIWQSDINIVPEEYRKLTGEWSVL